MAFLRLNVSCILISGSGLPESNLSQIDNRCVSRESMENQGLAGKSRTFFEYGVLCLLLGSAAVALAQDARPRPQDNPSVAEQRVFLNKYCVTCHSDKLRTAQLSLQTLISAMSRTTVRF